MKLSLSLACVFGAFASLSHGFLLTGLASRKASPAPSKGLYSVDYDLAPPRLDEYGLPIDPADLRPKPKVSLKDQIYQAVDTVGELVDSYKGQSSRRREEETREIIRQRRANAKALAVKDRVVETLDFVAHPGKVWKELVETPLQARKQKKAAERARLEATLQRVYAAKNRFYDTLDVLESTSRTTVKVAKQVGKAVVKAPETVQSVAKTVQEKTDAVAKVATSVGSVVSKLSGVIIKKDKKKEDQAAGAAVTGAAVVEEATKASSSSSNAEKAKVREIWETKQETAVRTIWEADELASPPSPPAPAAVAATADAPPAPAAAAAPVSTPVAVAPAPASPVASVEAPVTPRLSFRARLDAEEQRRRPAAARAPTPAAGATTRAAAAPGMSFRARVDAEEERFGARRARMR